MEVNTRYQELASKWLDNTITSTEKEEFEQWYAAGQDNHLKILADSFDNEEAHKQFILDKINRSIGFTSTKINRVSYGLKVAGMAAAFLLVSLIGILVYNKGNKGGLEHSTLVQANQFVEGSGKAVLTLGNGEVIVLDDLKTGVTSAQSGVSISKTSDGILRFHVDESQGRKANANIAYNTLHIPVGGQYHVILPDSTHVWLNASSTLTFPTQFNKNERTVELTGEAYFSVNKQGPSADERSSRTSVPFIVKTNKQDIHVLGTEFNVNAYEDEPFIKTTLLEGVVEIRQLEKNRTSILKPGQQAQLANIGDDFQIATVNTEEYTAWKDGYFYYNSSDIYEVMRQFSRWYDIEVEFENSTADDLFVGKFPRSLPLDKALIVLETVGVKVKMNGRTLIIQ